MKINGKTTITGIFGCPVQHTLSPAMHNAAFKDLGLNFCYLPFLVLPEHLPDAVKTIQALNFRGVNVTVPHKQAVIPHLDEIDKEASFIGAVNTIVNNKGRLTGHNTDGRGFMKSLDEKRISVHGKKILIHGAGGAARAVSYYLCQKAEWIFLYGRTDAKVQRLVKDLKNIRSNISSADSLANLERYDMLINATPLGLKKKDPLPFDVTLLRKHHVVCDLIYTKTRLTDEASKKRCTVIDGLGMLLWQGALAFRLWTGKQPDIQVMKKALRKSR